MDETTAALIADLKAAIAELEAGTEEAADRVAELAGRIERRLDAEAELHDDDDTIREEIREGAVRFEADHPKLADALRRIVDAIGGIGL
jgi:chromosome segregation ATPase